MRVKTPQQIAGMRVGGQHLTAVFEVVESAIKPGVTTEELDSLIKKEILRQGDRPAFLNYEGFPKSSCISVNEEVIHAIPGDRVLQEGDIVTVDVGLWHDRVCVDAARTWPVGQIDSESARLINATTEALRQGVAAVRAGARVGEISAAVQRIADREGLGIVRHFTGHGVGLSLHEEPSIPNYGAIEDGETLKAGLTICIEPMFNLGGDEVSTLSDGWTVVTVDGSRSAQIEHTILVTETGSEILV